MSTLCSANCWLLLPFLRWTFQISLESAPHLSGHLSVMHPKGVWTTSLVSEKGGWLLAFEMNIDWKEGGRGGKKSKVRKMADSGQPQCVWCEITSLREFDQGLKLCKSLFQQNLRSLWKLLWNVPSLKVRKNWRVTQEVARNVSEWRLTLLKKKWMLLFWDFSEQITPKLLSLTDLSSNCSSPTVTQFLWTSV